MKNVRCYGWGGAGEPISVHPPNSSQPSAMRCDAPEAATTSTAPQMSCLFFAAEGLVGLFGSWLCPNKHFGHARVSL